jgi:F-type H+-transporting ATPase subunit a
LIGIIFIFGWSGSPSIILVCCLTLLEFVVAFIQAYVFTFLTSLFIGSAVEEKAH